MRTNLNEKLISTQKLETLSFELLQQRMKSQLLSFSGKNQTLQKKANAESDPQFMKSFQGFQEQMRSELASLKSIFEILKKKGNTTPQKRIVATIESELSKEQEKFQTNVKKIITSSFNQRIDVARKSTIQHSDSQINSNVSDRIQEINDSDRSEMEAQNQIVQQQKQLQKEFNNWNQDIDLEQQLQEEKQNELNKFEKDIIQVNKNFAQMIVMIDEDQEKIDDIQENTQETNHFVIKANQEMNSANKLQKSAKKKYIIFAFLILIALGVTLTLVFTQM